MTETPSIPRPEAGDPDLAIAEMEKKYERLVWYARSQPATAIEFWEKVAPHIRDGAFQAQMRVEEDYPDEVTQLRGENGDWQHGFHSGMLAALRFTQMCHRQSFIEDGDESFWIGGVDDAHSFFPELDT